MEECGASLQISPGETLPTASWVLTATLTQLTFMNHVGKWERETFFKGTVTLAMCAACYTFFFLSPHPTTEFRFFTV